jgi:hypothetical protein
MPDEIAALVEKRNAHHGGADWRFTTDAARVNSTACILRHD